MILDTKYCYAEHLLYCTSSMLSVASEHFMLNVFMLSDLMVSVIILHVVALIYQLSTYVTDLHVNPDFFLTAFLCGPSFTYSMGFCYSALSTSGEKYFGQGLIL